MSKPVGYDKRARFGWCNDLDQNPQVVCEIKTARYIHPVAVIPLPFNSAKMRAKVRAALKGIVWPE